MLFSSTVWCYLRHPLLIWSVGKLRAIDPQCLSWSQQTDSLDCSNSLIMPCYLMHPSPVTPLRHRFTVPDSF